MNFTWPLFRIESNLTGPIPQPNIQHHVPALRTNGANEQHKNGTSQQATSENKKK